MPGDMVPIFGMITGTIMTAMMVIGAVMIFRGPVGQAIGRRIHGGRGDADGVLLAEVDQLRDHLAALEGQVGELGERLDFTERLLARQDPARVPGAQREDP